MNRLTAIGLASLVAWGVLIATKYAGFSPLSRDERPARVVPAERPVAAVPGESAVLPVSAEPRMTAGFATPNRIQTARPSDAALEFRAARDLRAYADALSARRAQLNGDERYHLAKTLEECQFVASMNEDLVAYAAKQRRLFLANLPAGDATNARRISAYEASDNTQRCAKFQGAKISPRDIEDLYEAAAQQGDARAQARILVADLNKQNNSTKPAGETGATTRMEGDDLSRLIGLLETHDPEALLIVGQFLSSSAFSQQLRIGPNGEVPEPSAFLGAFSLVACDFGPDCIAVNRESLNACAYAGYCNAQSFEELYQNFLASPWAYAQAMRYRGIIHDAITTRNWALIGLIPKSSRNASAH
jgi:hypothetical protein